MNTRRTALAAACLALAASLVACGGSSTGQSKPTTVATSTKLPAADAKLAKLVPAEYRNKSLTYATDATYPPNEYTASDGKTMVGWEIDLGNMVAAKLGLKSRWVDTPFDSLVPGIKAGKYDASFGSFTVTPDRMKVVDMVSYYRAGESLVYATGNPKHLSPDNLCGARIAVQVGNVEVDDAAHRSKACVAKGKAPIKVSQYQLQTDVTLAVVSNKADGMLLDSPVAGWIVHKNGTQLALDKSSWSVAPYGVVVPKTPHHALAAAIRAAIKSLQQDGTYDALLKKYGVQAGAVHDSALNPSAS